MSAGSLPIAKLLAEWEARRSARAGETLDAVRKADELRSYLFPAQRQCTNDPARQVAARCTRRSGKSSGWLREMMATALTVPDSRQVYINTTRPECEAVAWVGTGRDGLLSLNRDYQCGAIPHMQKLRLSFPHNGATIDCIPADDLRAINRLRGRAFHRVLVEEAQKSPHLDYTVKEVLQPAMVDYDGQIVLIGTPSRECIGLFYDITREDSDAHGWSTHHWSVLDNPHFGDSREERHGKTLGKILAQNAWTGDEPEFLREWLGLWVREDAYYVYDVHKVDDAVLYWGAPPAPSLDGVHVIPKRAELEPFLPRAKDGGAKEWFYIFGVDLGYMDPFAYHGWAFSYDDPCLYELGSWKRSGLSFDEQGDIMRALNEEWKPITMPVDAGGHAVKSAIKGWSEGWQERKPLPVEEAHKTEKQTAIGWMNADIRKGLVKFRRNSATLAEMRALQWKVSIAGEILGENKSTDNHNADSSLYSHRHARHHRFEDPSKRLQEGTSEWYEREEQRMEEQVLEQLREQEEEGWGGGFGWQ